MIAKQKMPHVSCCVDHVACTMLHVSCCILSSCCMARACAFPKSASSPACSGGLLHAVITSLVDLSGRCRHNLIISALGGRKHHEQLLQVKHETQLPYNWSKISHLKLLSGETRHALNVHAKWSLLLPNGQHLQLLNEASPCLQFWLQPSELQMLTFREQQQPNCRLNER